MNNLCFKSKENKRFEYFYLNSIVIFWVLLSFLGFSNLIAKNYPQKLFTVDEGLPQSNVTNIIKDSYGFIWLATNGGLAKFDGTSFKNYTINTGYPFNLVVGIIEKEPGVIWVADYITGLWEFDNDQIKKIVFDDSLSGKRLNFLLKMDDGRVLMGAEPGGLYIFENDSITNLNSKNSPVIEPIISAAIDYDGSVWIGTYKDGVQKIKNDRIIATLTEENGLPSNEIRYIMPRKNGQVWFGTSKGLYVLNDNIISQNFNYNFPDRFIKHIYEETENSIWISSINKGGGLFHICNNKIEEVIKNFSGFYTSYVYVDETSNQFIGTSKGLLIIPDRSFVNYGVEDGLNDTYVTSVAQDKNGTIWVGTQNDGLYYLHKEIFEPYYHPKFDCRILRVTFITLIDGQLWCGTRKGLYILENDRLIRNQITKHFEDKEIRQIVKTKKDEILIAEKEGLYKINNGNLYNIIYNLDKENYSYWGLQRDKNNLLWMATNGNGLWTLNDTVWVQYTDEGKGIADNFYGIRKDDSGNLYFPSSEGAYLWDGKQLTQIFDRNQTVWDILPTKDEGFWLGTSQGLFRKKNGNLFLYNRKMGFIGSEFNISSFYKDKEGGLWFGSIGGLIKYQKTYIKYEKQPLKAYILSVETKDASYFFPFKKKIVLKPDQNNLKINFVTLDYKNPESITYRYKLGGYDNYYSDITQQTVANYTNLPNGEYIFCLQTKRQTGRWGETLTKLSFQILKPWWQSWWLYLGYLILFCAFVWGLIRWRINLLQKRNFLLEQKVEKRTIDLKLANKRLVKEIEERQKVEEDLEGEKERLAVTLRSITDGLIKIDIDGNIMLFNKVAEKLTGFKIDEAIGQKLKSILHIYNEKTKHKIRNPIRDFFQKHKYSLPLTVYMKSKEGSEKLIAINGAPVFDKKNENIGYVLVFRDISRQKKMEEEILKAQKMESISILAGGIAHDFNNILSGILGNVQLARFFYPEGKDINKYFDGVEEAIDVATTLTQQLLTFSKGGKPVKRVVNITDLLKEAVEFALRGSNVKSKFVINDDLWNVEVDTGQINQVINNLVINADQAMPNGGAIEIKAENINLDDKAEQPLLSEGEYIKIEISDNGIGIPQENLVKIFDPYFTTKQKGSGLGLASAHSVIEKHNGLITVKSRLGWGTTFDIYLPASPGKFESDEKKTEEILKGHGKILVMDDEPYIRELIGNILTSIGYDVGFAKDGREAIDIYQKEQRENKPFDLVIMDLTIPGGMGGKEAIKNLLKIYPKAKVIVSSGYSTDGVLANYRSYGFCGRIIKPFKIDEVSKIVSETISKG
jgi:PAS domain S-box-containing protein